MAIPDGLLSLSFSLALALPSLELVEGVGVQKKSLHQSAGF